MYTTQHPHNPMFHPTPTPKPPKAPNCILDTTSQHSKKHMHMAPVGTPSHMAHMGWVAAIMPSRVTCRSSLVRCMPSGSGRGGCPLGKTF